MEPTAKKLYTKLESKRQAYLDRARRCALFTIPSIMPPEGHNEHTKLYTPYQGMGARGVNNLASKLLLALMPPNSPFFRLGLDDATAEQMADQQGMKAEVENALAKIERKVMKEFEEKAFRVTAGEALKHLIITGNGLLYIDPEGRLKFYQIDKYVIRRDPRDQVTDIVVKEQVALSTLPDKLRERVEEAASSNTDRSKDKDTPLSLYTHIYREGRRWRTYQEVEGEIVPKSEGSYPLHKTPWLPLRMIKVDGESYGRSYLEEYIGDLISLEGLTKAIVQGSAAAAKVLFLVNPNGVTKEKDLAKSESGDVKTGDANDVSVLQLQKYADFRIAFETINNIEQRLSYAFLLNTAVQRDAERVTAEEIRYMAGELEDALGGVYSVLSQEFQLPLVQRTLYTMQRRRAIPSLPEGTVSPTITTGLEALGRGHDLNRLDVFIGGAMQTFGPQVLSQYLNVGDYLTRRGTALGIDMSGLVRSEEEIQQQQQQAQQAQMAQMVAQGGMDMARDVVKEGVKQNGGDQ